MPIIPDNYRYLKDGEKIEASDLAFGLLLEGGCGWGKITQRIIGDSWVEDGCETGHPSLMVRFYPYHNIDNWSKRDRF